MKIRPRVLIKYLLPALLLLAPAFALAALATNDLTGTRRMTPPTMGALEVSTAATNPNPSTPAGIALSVQRIGG